ncbi:junctional adhesion molecule-like, partial [Xyrauchen texanus]|uniref:junctional adhesion molecule-like n=1 Tax=Xyrauchen texanus TaxID=154827 RepID=UPI00224259BA
MTTFKYMKMLHLSNCVLMPMLLMIADGITVKGLSDPLVVPLGGSVVLPCYVDKPLTMEDLEVDWRRSDSETLVHLYQDGESRPEVQQQDYHDRAHFFTDQIQHGNFSLLLNNVTAEDEGEYRCTVFSGQDSGATEVEIKHVERLIVSGSDHSISAYAGEDVTLNCSVDSHITPEEIEELSWKKTDKDGDILVLLYQNNEPLPESSHEQYRDRVEFFTDEISKGNFSLRLKSVRTEDKGVYMCQVFAGGVSANTTVELEQLGFSALHIMVLILCFTASGSALLLCGLIYCTSQHANAATTKPVRALEYFHVSLPNIAMFLAFVFWGVTEGSFYESICCCTLFILRPLMLISFAPYLKDISDAILHIKFAIFELVYYSVLFRRFWEYLVHYSWVDRSLAIVTCGLSMLLFFIYIISRLMKRRDLDIGISHGEMCEWIWDKLTDVAVFTFHITSSIHFILMFYIFGVPKN